jgi:hypothetical protein
MKSTSNREGEGFEETAFFSGQFKGKCRNCGQIGHKLFQCKNCGSHNSGNNGNSSGRIFCSYCCKPGHDRKNCFKLKKEDSRSNNASSNNGNSDRPNFGSQDVVFTATASEERIRGDIWICDSGASGHYCMSIEGMFDIQDIDEKITVGNGNKMVATKVGSLRRCVIQVDGTVLDIVINEVKYVPDSCANLFSVNKAIKNGFDLSNQGENIALTKGSASITFDRIIKSLDGTVSGIKMVPHDPPAAYVAQNKLVSSKNIDVNKFHEMIGHCGLDSLKKTAQVHGLKLKGDFKVCKDTMLQRQGRRTSTKTGREEVKCLEKEFI